MANSGKLFEKDFKESFPPNISIDRLYDTMGGFAGIKNICDFIVYQYPYEYYFELKSYEAKSIPLSAISKAQYEGLLKKSYLPGVMPGVIFDYRDKDPHNNEAYFIPIWRVKLFKDEATRKSISIEYARKYGNLLPGRCKVTRWTYDIEKFLISLREEGTHGSR